MVQTRTKITLGLMAVIACLAFGGATLWRLAATAPDREGVASLKLLAEVLRQVEENYVERVDRKKLLEGAVNGMLAALDPHSAYLPPEPFSEMKVEISGSFGGLGIEIALKEGKLTVISPIEDTPAWRAGIKAGDHIWKIDGTPTRDLTIVQAVKKMRGERGTKVTLTILRNGETEPREFPLVRDIIQTKSLKARSLEPGYGYVRISHFQERTGEDFANALRNLRAENGGTLKGLVLDLRNNPGGLLEVAVAVAGRFVGERLDNGLIVYTEGREEFAKRRFSATVGEKEPPYPLVVLINSGSASASEIVAGALQDYGRAVIMGTPSFGKGSVQTVIPMKDGAGLKLTTALYYTPKGRSIQARGIIPDVIVENAELKSVTKDRREDFHEKDLDNHLGGGKDAVPAKGPIEKNEESGKKGQPARHAVGPEDDAKKDFQLARALDLLKSWEVLQKVAGGIK
ncbi:carboxyl-terminal protease [Geobacter metallireducens RCH3]|uniref:Periplasmic carboxy-terminal processing protease n=1 Tax=Geobacter metallireducens (strain ATCC 53774 / DSM 7210 / GS-15) TaxID=269799 RepID=Q39S43_GEOMG|nr:S41 family peptidase [Geobacter metallireducens]ABB32931.1 periplasmic carboxy-terminal processing protease [Geobacter metallireducens GS-15]EHP88934.1 carboxyl-terminal protease [Geobacter metallireducens RCH3]